jgi:hypothetical protein
MLGPQDGSDGAGHDCDSMFMMMSQRGDVFISESSVLALFELHAFLPCLRLVKYFNTMHYYKYYSYNFLVCYLGTAKLSELHLFCDLV